MERGGRPTSPAWPGPAQPSPALELSGRCQRGAGAQAAPQCRKESAQAREAPSPRDAGPAVARECACARDPRSPVTSWTPALQCQERAGAGGGEQPPARAERLLPELGLGVWPEAAVGEAQVACLLLPHPRHLWLLSPKPQCADDSLAGAPGAQRWGGCPGLQVLS